MKAQIAARAMASAGLTLITAVFNSNAIAETSYLQKYVATLERTCQNGDLLSCVEGADLWSAGIITGIMRKDFLSRACNLNDVGSCETYKNLSSGDEVADSTPKIDPDNFKISVSDRDAQPLVRIPPQMPIRFISFTEHSGYCRVKFNVSPAGKPFNVSTTYCTSEYLKTATIKSVQKWKYNPKIVNGEPVARYGVEAKILYHVQDEQGKILPFPDE